MGAKLKDIANLAGVSEGTASLALNNRPGVNENTRQKIQEIAKEMGYYPSASAKSLAERKSGLIGLLIPNISNQVHGRFARGIENALRDLNYKIIFATTENNVDYEKKMIEQFVSFRVEGAIIYPMIKDTPDTSHLNILEKNDIPLVFIGSHYRGINAPYVMSDIFNATCNAVEYLYSKGCRKFFYLGGCKTIVTNELKLRALQKTLQGHGITFGSDRYIELDKTTYECAYAAAKGLISKTTDFDAIISGDVYTSLAVYNALNETEMKVPEDVSIISFDNLVPSEIYVVQLTCIEQNIEKIVNETINVLFDKIAGKTVDKNILVETKLILRDTTR